MGDLSVTSAARASGDPLMPLIMAMTADMQQIHIPSVESLEQGRDRSRELPFRTQQPRQALLA